MNELNKNQDNHFWGGRREGAGRPKGSIKKPSFGDYFSEEERVELINRIKQEIKGEPKGDIVKMTVEQIFGKPKQPLVGGDENDEPIQFVIAKEIAQKNNINDNSTPEPNTNSQ